MHFIYYARCRCNKIQRIFSFQPFLYHLQMEKSQKAAAETEAQSNRGLRLIKQSRVVQHKPLERILQVLIMGAVRGIHSAEYHGLCFLIAGKRLHAGIISIRNRIPDLCLPHIFQRCRNVTNHTGRKLFAGNKPACAKNPHLHYIRLSTGHAHTDSAAALYNAVKDPAEYDHALVAVI